MAGRACICTDCDNLKIPFICLFFFLSSTSEFRHRKEDLEIGIFTLHIHPSFIIIHPSFRDPHTPHLSIFQYPSLFIHVHPCSSRSGRACTQKNLREAWIPEHSSREEHHEIIGIGFMCHQLLAAVSHRCHSDSGILLVWSKICPKNWAIFMKGFENLQRSWMSATHFQKKSEIQKVPKEILASAVTRATGFTGFPTKIPHRDSPGSGRPEESGPWRIPHANDFVPGSGRLPRWLRPAVAWL